MSWSRNYDCCVQCGTTNHKHEGKGFCKKCWNKKFYIKNKDKYGKWNKEYRLKPEIKKRIKEKFGKEYHKKWRLNNPDKKSIQDKKWTDKNKNRAKLTDKKYHEKNKERCYRIQRVRNIIKGGFPMSNTNQEKILLKDISYLKETIKEVEEQLNHTHLNVREVKY